MLVRQIHDPSLAQYAYLVGCPRSGEAILFDPERDIDRYFELAAAHKLRIVAAADTHIHADYLSGLREFAERGITVYASDEGGPEWRYEWLVGSDYPHQLVKHGDRFTVGNIDVEVIHTPGHTPEHVVYTITDRGSGATEPMAVITGDFVFVGDLGRPDLLEEAAGVQGTMDPGARQLYASLERFRALPEHVQVWPAHGAGSACGKSLGDIPSSTVGYELRFNPAVRAATSEDAFVEYILAGQPEPPMYFARMKRDNKVGPRVLGTAPTPPRLSAEALVAGGMTSPAVVVDTRPRTRFLPRHLTGSLLAELTFQFVNITGSYITEHDAIYLVIEEAQLEQAVRELVRIGLDDVRGWVTPAEYEAYLANSPHAVSTESITMDQLEARRLDGGVHVLDVRGKVDFEAAHVPGAINVAHTRLLARLRDIPRDQPLLVHCASGTRSAHAVALLERHGYAVTNVAESFSSYKAAGAVPA
jgi:hydroxyacylglutathione hydrolase